jgi:hypothetical protein
VNEQRFRRLTGIKREDQAGDCCSNANKQENRLEDEEYHQFLFSVRGANGWAHPIEQANWQTSGSAGDMPDRVAVRGTAAAAGGRSCCRGEGGRRQQTKWSLAGLLAATASMEITQQLNPQERS